MITPMRKRWNKNSSPFVRKKSALSAPGRVVFGTLPKTATGKIQKYELREKTKKLFIESG